MKRNLLEIENQFSNHFRELLQIQQNIWEQLSTYSFDLTKDEITLAILERMGAFWHFHVNNTKHILQRNINPTAADFFTETCQLYLKAYFENKYGCQVKSEVSIVPGKNAIRPDISIWKNKELVAVIELKINDGWKRKDILHHLTEREQIIKTHHPNTYFGVIAFWNFFDQTTPEWSTKYTSLLHWNEKESHPRTGGRVEDLMQQIEKHMNLFKEQ